MLGPAPGEEGGSEWEKEIGTGGGVTAMAREIIDTEVAD